MTEVQKYIQDRIITMLAEDAMSQSFSDNVYRYLKKKRADSNDTLYSEYVSAQKEYIAMIRKISEFN